jgi:hypothetical protein
MHERIAFSKNMVKITVPNGQGLPFLDCTWPISMSMDEANLPFDGQGLKVLSHENF